MAPNFKMMGLSFALVIGSNAYLDRENEMHVQIVRALYGISQLACYAMMAYLYFKAKNNTEPGVVTVKEDVGFGQEGEADEKVTISEHDMRVCWKDIQRFGIGTVVSVFIHYKWGYFPPLVIQTITQPFNVYQTQLFRIYVCAERAWGELRRPWQDPTSMGSQWSAWNDTVTSALTGERPAPRQGKKAAKRAAKKGK